MKLAHVLFAAVAVASSACTVPVSTIPVAFPGAPVRPEVAAGFEAYEKPLAAWGTWGPDRDAGVHWCPSPDAVGGTHFHPYLSRGHWDIADAPIGKAPAGSPVWRSDDSATWGEITTHHGWWIQVASDEGGPWCWVPGVEETPARVEWREDEDEGFVGWAPEPPDWMSDESDEIAYEDGLDWAFTLLGTLLSDHPEDNVLSGPAEREARTATASRGANGAPVRRVIGPSRGSIQAARAVLAEYVVKHPDVIAAAVKSSTSAASRSNASGSSSSEKSSSSSSSSSKKDKDGITVSVGLAPMPMPMPTAMIFYDALMAQPAVAPVALAPHPHTADMGSGGLPAAFGSASPAITYGGGSRGAHGVSAALRMPSYAYGSSPSRAHAAASHVSTYSAYHYSSSSSSSHGSHSSSYHSSSSHSSSHGRR